MAASIVLTVTAGPLRGQSWTFEAHDLGVIGRHSECRIRLPDDAAHKTVSRHHALLEIAPPLARVRDFGSLNGTFVNGAKIGARERSQSLDDAQAIVYPQRDLHDGDSLRMGDTTLRVEVRDAPSPPIPRNDTEGNAHFEDYELERELGRGAMGQVFLARHRSNGATCALKLMLPRVATDARSRGIFWREVALMKSLAHPNVVGMHAFGTHEDKFFFTLDFCDLGNLCDWMSARRREASPGEACTIALQMLRGLDYLAGVPVSVQLENGEEQTATGLVHRDLSPQNILLTQDVRGKLTAKIADVGLGKAFDTAGLSGLTLTGEASGKPVFMPRQQVVDYKFAKPEVDVWAAAATLYFLLTGHYPRDFPPRSDPWRTLLATDPVPIRDRDPNVPPALAQVVDRALDDRDELYYKSANTLLLDLQTALQTLGVLDEGMMKR